MTFDLQQIRMPRRTMLASTAVVGAGAALTACSDTPASQTNEEARALVVGATAEPQSMDPITQSGAAIAQVLLYNVYETLVKLDGEGNLKPLLAQSWSTSPDRLTYTFTLQPSAKFSDGTAVDAKTVVANIERVKSGAKTVTTPKAQMALVASATATDDRTVQVKLTRPSQEWLFNMASVTGMIAPTSSFATLATTPVGSGPFTFGAWKKGESVSLARNESYWGTAPRFDGATFRYFADANSMNAAMLAGDIDIISDLTAPEALGQFSDTSKYTVTEGTTNGEVVLGFNQGPKGNAALKKVKVRQAICHAIDRKALLATVWGGKGTLIGSMVPPTDPWYEDLSSTYAFDVAKAKALLKEAGESTLSLRLRVPTLPYGPTAAQFITSALKTVGITVKVDEIDFPTWLKEVYTDGNYDMTIVNHVEPHDIFSFANPDYYWHYSNAEFTKLVTDADQAETDVYVSKMKQAAKLLATDAAACWLWLFPHLVVSKADITGVQANATSSSFDLTVLASRNG